MTTISILGKGNMGPAIADIARKGGHDVEMFDSSDAARPVTGDVVVLAVPYPAVAGILETRRDELVGKVVVDVTNPLDFETFDSLTVPADSSATAEIAAALPGSAVLKAFNTNFAATLATGAVGGSTATVQIAGDDADAKSRLADVVRAGGLAVVDAGSLARARELEALGFLQISLAAREQIGWTGGFALHGN